MLRLSVALVSAACVSAFHPAWQSKPSWYGESTSQAPTEQEDKSLAFPLHPVDVRVSDYKWMQGIQRAQVETNDHGAVYFRRYIAQEVFASQLAEYLGVCVAKARYIPWNSRVSHAWQDVIQDVSQHITPDNVARVQYLFEDQVGVQEIEFIDGAVVKGYQAKKGYGKILWDIGKLFAFDMFINDPHNCRFCQCGQENGHYWTCKDEDDTFNFIISPTRGVCGHTRAYRRMDLVGFEGQKFREFFHLARSMETTTELSKQIAYVAGEMFGDNLTMDRREAAEVILKGARWMLLRLQELSAQVFQDIATTSGLHESFAFGIGERIRMLRIILGVDIDDNADDEELEGDLTEVSLDKTELEAIEDKAEAKETEEEAPKFKQQPKGSLSPQSE